MKHNTFCFQLMQMTTICACPGECTESGSPKCGSGPGSSGGLGGGSILLIVYADDPFLFLIQYFLFILTNLCI